jgi:hypothetical protein
MRDGLGIPSVPDHTLFRYLSPDIPTMPEDAARKTFDPSRTAASIEAARLRKKGRARAIGDGTHGE